MGDRPVLSIDPQRLRAVAHSLFRTGSLYSGLIERVSKRCSLRSIIQESEHSSLNGKDLRVSKDVLFMPGRRWVHQPNGRCRRFQVKSQVVLYEGEEMLEFGRQG